MSKTLRSAALAVGLVGLLYSDGSAIKTGPGPFSSTENVDKSKDQWRAQMDYDGSVYPLQNFSEDDKGLYKKYFNLAVSDLKSMGLKISDPKIIFFERPEDLPKEADEGIVTVVGSLEDHDFANGDLRYGFNTSGESSLEYKLSPMFFDVGRMDSKKEKSFQIYESSFKYLAAANLARNGLPLVEIDYSRFNNEERFNKEFTNSIDVWKWVNTEVVISLLQGALMGKRTREGISKESIIENLKRYPALMRQECRNPARRRALVSDYGKNPEGLLLKLEYLYNKRQINERKTPN